MATVSGTAFSDTNGNGVQDGGESGISGLNVVLAGTDTSTGQNTDSSGNYSFSGVADGAYMVTCTSPANTAPSTPNPASITVAGANVVVNFGFAAASAVRECFTPASEWIDKVCWIVAGPVSPCVQIQFKKYGVPYACCRYPNTLYSDYLAIKAIADKGRHVRDWYYKLRPYIPVPVGS